VRVIELRNDLKAVMNEIGKVLEHVYDPTAAPTQDAGDADAALSLSPFARVDAVAPSSPASDAVRRLVDVGDVRSSRNDQGPFARGFDFEVWWTDQTILSFGVSAASCSTCWV
jgi:hypothetical protein